jgi:hypothetical protein
MKVMESAGRRRKMWFVLSAIVFPLLYF